MCLLRPSHTHIQPEQGRRRYVTSTRSKGQEEALLFCLFKPSLQQEYKHDHGSSRQRTVERTKVPQNKLLLARVAWLQAVRKWTRAGAPQASRVHPFMRKWASGHQTQLNNSRPRAALVRYAEVRLVGQTLEREAQGTENQSPVISRNTILCVCATEIEMFAEISLCSGGKKSNAKVKEAELSSNVAYLGHFTEPPPLSH